MKKLLTISLFILLSSFIIAQQNPSFVCLQAGASFPVANFSGKELPDGGFALIGFSAALEGAWFFKPWIGVGASAGMNKQPVDVGYLGYEKLQDNPFLTDLRIRSDPHLSLSIYAGLFFQFPLVQKLSLTAKALGGLMYAQTPYQLYKAEYYLIGKNWYEITSSGDYEASFLIGAGLQYDCNDYIGFSIQSDFTYNNMDFGFNQSDGTVRTDVKTVSYINLRAGLVIKLGKSKSPTNGAS